MTKSVIHSIDRLALGIILTLGLMLGGLSWIGQTCSSTCFMGMKPHVKTFSWQNQRLGASDRAFVLTFDRPMDALSVEKNLVINPSLPGKISWAGRRLAYTLNNPIPYGENYQLHLRDAKEKFPANSTTAPVLEPFFGEFKSRDRAFAYISSQSPHPGQLILHNFTKNQTTPLTPENLVVFDFRFYPKGDKILFSAAPRSRGIQGIRELELYTITTNLNQPTDIPFSAKLTRILGSENYQNNQFELAPDGETIVLARINRHNPTDFDLWMLKNDTPPQRLNVQGGEFLIAPDSQTLAVAKGEGISLLPLQPYGKPLDFLPKFGRILGFSSDGSAAAMVNFNTDNSQLRYTKTLVYVNNQGLQKPLLNLNGSIQDCKFNPTGSHLYCLLTQLVPGDVYREDPYFAKINVKTKQITPLLQLPNYRDMKISLSADGLAILFDQIITTTESIADNPLSSDSGETIIGGHLWLLFPPINDEKKQEKPDLEELPLVGFRPQWSP